MDHDRPAHRSYNEKEIGALIQRATEMHEEAMGTSERSLSLKEIEHIAAELGLPPEYMRTAARSPFRYSCGMHVLKGVPDEWHLFAVEQ